MKNVRTPQGGGIFFDTLESNIVTFLQSILSIQFNWRLKIKSTDKLKIVGRHAMRCPWTSDHERSTYMGEACTSRKPKPGLRTRTRINANAPLDRKFQVGLNWLSHLAFRRPTLHGYRDACKLDRIIT